MPGISRICLLGFGEVGSTLASDLLATTTVELRVWDRLFAASGSLSNQRLQKLPSERIHVANTAEDAATGCQLVISAVTAGQCLQAAESILHSIAADTWFLDLNSVAPSTKIQLGDMLDRIGGRFVEVAVMSPIHPKRIASPMLLGGPHAARFLPLAEALGFMGAEVTSESLGIASASKMCRSVMIKGMEALLTESLLAAQHYGVEGMVLSSLENLFPGIDWSEKSRYMISRSLEHGARRAEEMQEVAKTVADAGLTPWMSEACVERQCWAPQFNVAANAADIGSMLFEINGLRKG